MLGTERPSDPPTSPESSTESSTGVYLLFADQVLTYVGRSADCRQRIKDHRTNGRPFDHAAVIPCGDADAVWIEKAIIQATEAVQNKVMFRRFLERRAAPPSPLPPVAEHPLTLIGKTLSRKRAGAFGLASEFEAAIRSGELVFHPKRPGSANHVITAGRLYEWAEAAQKVKYPHA